MLDGDALGGRIDRFRDLELRRVDAEVDVGHERSQDEHAIGAFDDPAHVFPSHGAFVDPQVLGVVFAHDGLAQECGGHGVAGAFDQSEQRVLQAEAVDFDAGKDDRAFRGAKHGGRFGEGFGQGVLVALGARGFQGERCGAGRIDHVSGDFDIHGAFLQHAGFESIVDETRRRDGIFQGDGRHGDLLEDKPLGVEIADLVVEERRPGSFAESRRAADDDHGGLFGIGARHAVQGVQAADAIRDAHDAEAVDTGIGVRGKARAGLATRPDDLEVAFDHLIVKPQHVVAGHAKNVLDPHFLQALYQVFTDTRGFRHCTLRSKLPQLYPKVVQRRQRWCLLSGNG